MASQKTIKCLAQTINQADSIILTTHKMCDGDGLGSMMSMFYALKKMKKKVRAISVDGIPDKYDFLSPQSFVKPFNELKTEIPACDLALLLDTNDSRLVEPLYSELKKKCKKLIFVDHHPLLELGPLPTNSSLVDDRAASTGELCYFLLKELKIKMTPKIATGIYVSILFDTQNFRFIKNSSVSYSICAKLFPFIKDNNSIHHHLFGIRTKEKLSTLAKTLGKIQYFCSDKVAILELSREMMDKNNLDVGEACDYIDMSMEVDSTMISVLIVGLSQNNYKLSFRSRFYNMTRLAELFAGGGHKSASGATLNNYKKNPREEVLKAIDRIGWLKKAS